MSVALNQQETRHKIHPEQDFFVDPFEHINNGKEPSDVSQEVEGSVRSPEHISAEQRIYIRI